MPVFGIYGINTRFYTWLYSQEFHVNKIVIHCSLKQLPFISEKDKINTLKFDSPCKNGTLKKIDLVSGFYKVLCGTEYAWDLTSR